MLRTEIKDGRTIYYYGSAEITKEEYMNMSGKIEDAELTRVRRFNVSISGQITEVMGNGSE